MCIRDRNTRGSSPCPISRTAPASPPHKIARFIPASTSPIIHRRRPTGQGRVCDMHPLPNEGEKNRLAGESACPTTTTRVPALVGFSLPTPACERSREHHPDGAHRCYHLGI